MWAQSIGLCQKAKKEKKKVLKDEKVISTDRGSNLKGFSLHKRGIICTSKKEWSWWVMIHWISGKKLTDHSATPKERKRGGKALFYSRIPFNQCRRNDRISKSPFLPPVVIIDSGKNY